MPQVAADRVAQVEHAAPAMALATAPDTVGQGAGDHIDNFHDLTKFAGGKTTEILVNQRLRRAVDRHHRHFVRLRIIVAVGTGQWRLVVFDFHCRRCLPLRRRQLGGPRGLILCCLVPEDVEAQVKDRLLRLIFRQQRAQGTPELRMIADVNH